MRRVVLLAALLLAGCGGPAGDLFEVKRSGTDRGANLTLVVSDDGHVTCNGTQHELPPKLLLQARDLTRRLAEQAELNLQLAAGPGSVLAYQVRMQAGTVAFADTSKPLPRAFTDVTVFTKDVSANVCGIDRT